MRFHRFIFLGLIFFLGCAPTAKESEAVKLALKPFATAIQDCEKNSGHWSARKNQEKLLATIQALDVSQCPKDLRVSWQGFVVALNRSCETERRGNGKGFQNLALALAVIGIAAEHPLRAIQTATQIDNAPSPEMRAAEQELQGATAKLGEVVKKYLARKTPP
jgi:hypothetical protein